MNRAEASRQVKASHLAAVAGREVARERSQAAQGEAAGVGVGGPTLDGMC